MIFPAKPLYGSAITALGVDPFRRINLTKVTRPDLWRLGQQVRHYSGSFGFPQARQCAGYALFCRVMSRYGGCRQLDPGWNTCGPTGYHADMVIPQGSVDGIAPIVKL